MNLIYQLKNKEIEVYVVFEIFTFIC